MLRKLILASLVVVFLAAFGSEKSAGASAAYFTVWSQSCSPFGGVDVTLTWNGGDPTSVQYIDISMRNNGWQTGSFSGGGPLPPGTTWLTAPGLMPNAVYFVRLSQPTAYGWWDQSPTFYFVTSPSCGKIFAVPTIEEPEEEDAEEPQSNRPPPITNGANGGEENCHPDYFNACIDPTARRGDYSCEDFPEPVYLTRPGTDPLGLDLDGDGIACE
jgi:hypothetical protein